MDKLTLSPVGKIVNEDGECFIQLDKRYIPALTNLDGFGYIQVIWWFSGCDNQKSRSKLVEDSPYKGAPEQLGTFATRSPERPNPIALTAAKVLYIDHENGIIGLAYIDALNNSPVVDIKPYTPSLDRVKNAEVPLWCANWPTSCEEAGEFDWSKVFNFEV